MMRREFVTLLGGAVVWPFGVNAQQALPVVGFLSSRSPEESAHLVEAFRGGLKDGGFIEGQSPGAGRARRRANLTQALRASPTCRCTTRTMKATFRPRWCASRTNSRAPTAS